MVTQPFKSNRLILCEGIEDAAFLRELIRRRRLNPFDVRPVKDVGDVAGISGFADALVASITVTGFRQINRLILIADSNSHWRTSFWKLREQIEQANAHPDVFGRFEIPSNPFEMSGGHPRLIILLNPRPTSKGALETLLWEVLGSQYARVKDCIDDVCQCVGIDRGSGKWPQAKLDKARVHTAIALINRLNPSIGLGLLWGHYPNLIPVTDHAFDELATRLSEI